jgi:hypothetical protein
MKLTYYTGEEVKVGDVVVSTVYPTEVETTMKFGYHEIDFDSGGCAKVWGFYLEAFPGSGFYFDPLRESILDKRIKLKSRI